MKNEIILPPEMLAEIGNIFKRGNIAELKYVGGKVQLIEIVRKKKIEVSITG